MFLIVRLGVVAVCNYHGWIGNCGHASPDVVAVLEGPGGSHCRGCAVAPAK